MNRQLFAIALVIGSVVAPVVLAQESSSSNGNHSYVNWRETFGEGLVTLLGN